MSDTVKVSEHLNVEVAGPEVLPFCNGQILLFSKRCPGSEGTNGDSLISVELSKKNGVLALADGAGGTPGGNEASSAVLKILRNTLVSDPKARLRNRILNAFEAGNADLMKKGTGAGTTLFVVEIGPSSFRCYHAGDSTILCVGQKGKRKFKSIAHSPSSYSVEAGHIAEDDALKEPNNHLVLNLLGNSELHIDISSEMELLENDTILLCSDGLSDNLTADEIAEIIRKGPLEDAAAELIELAGTRMLGLDKSGIQKPDDLSFILYRPSS